MNPDAHQTHTNNRGPGEKENSKIAFYWTDIKHFLKQMSRWFTRITEWPLPFSVLHKMCQRHDYKGAESRCDVFACYRAARRVKLRSRLPTLECWESLSRAVCCLKDSSKPVYVSDCSFSLEQFLCVRQADILETGSWMDACDVKLLFYVALWFSIHWE